MYRPYISTTFSPPPPSNTFDLEDLVGGHSRLAIVGLSTSRFYLRKLLSQPFEASKILIQLSSFEKSSFQDYSFDSSDSDEEVDYFVDVRSDRRETKVRPSKHRSVQLFRKPTQRDEFIESPSIFRAIQHIIKLEGPLSLWRGLNASCLCSAATTVLNAYLTSFLASLLDIADPQFTNLATANNLFSLLLVGAGGCALTSFLLSPLYTIRTRLIASKMVSKKYPRSVRMSIFNLLKNGMFFAPMFVVWPTMLSNVFNYLVSAAVPTGVKLLGIDMFNQKTLLFTDLLTSFLRVLVRMPFDTMALRAQLVAAKMNNSELIIKPVEYTGVLSTCLNVLRGKIKISTLYNGWRLECMGLLSEWGYTWLEESRQLSSQEF